jgi:hypothetical protein
VLPDTQFYPFSNSGSSAPVAGPQITVVNGEGILLDFTLPDPQAQMGIDGEVHLQWTLTRFTLLDQRTMRRPGPTRAPEDEAEKPENRIAALFAHLTPAQRQAVNTRLAASATAKPAVSRPRLAMRPVLSAAKLPPAPPRRLVAPQMVPDARMAQKSESLRQALCEAYRGNVPGYASACTVNSRAH